MDTNLKNAGIADIDAWIEAQRQELTALERTIAPLIQEQAVAKERLTLLEKLRETFAAGVSNGAASEVVTPEPAPRVLESTAEDILREASRPMHVSSIRRELVKRGVTIPGQGSDANVITRLARSSRFIRVARGTYALSDEKQ